MRYGLVIVSILLGVSGCASFQEAYDLDQEFGQATRSTWEAQIAYPEASPTGASERLEGITAENIMDVYTKTFAEPPQQTQTLNLGSIAGD